MGITVENMIRKCVIRTAREKKVFVADDVAQTMKKMYPKSVPTTNLLSKKIALIEEVTVVEDELRPERFRDTSMTKVKAFTWEGELELGEA